MRATVLSSLAALEAVAAASIDALVTLPPRDPAPVGQRDLEGLFDDTCSLHGARPRSPVAWRACARVLKPGAHALVAASGDMDLIGMALRLAEFEMRDAILVEGATGHLPILLARRHLEAKTLIENICRHGAGALNIAATRVRPPEDDVILGIADPQGRWPANLVHDGSHVVEEAMRSRRGKPSAAPLFKSLATDTDADSLPVALARHLLRLTVPPGGTVLDPFAATDVVARAAASLGMKAVLVMSAPAKIARKQP